VNNSRQNQQGRNMSRSQLRLEAITGSLTQIDDIASIAQPAALIPAEDLNDVLGQFAGAVRRIHGGDDFTNSPAGVFTHATSVFSGSVELKDGSGDARVTLGSDGNVTATGDVTARSGSFSGDMIVAGDLFVNGTTTYINTANVTMEDPVLLLGSGSVVAGDRGIVMRQTATMGHVMGWDNDASQFVLAQIDDNPAVLTDFSNLITSDSYSDLRIGGLTATSGAFSADVSASAGIYAGAAVDAGTLKARDLTATHVLFASASGQIVGESSLTYDAVEDVLTMVTGSAYDFAIGHQLIFGDSGYIYNNNNDLFLNDPTGQLFFFDAGASGSIAAGGVDAWSDANGIALSDSASEWNNYKSIFGEVSLLAAIVQAGIGITGTGKFVKKMTGNLSAASISLSPLSIVGGVNIGSGLDFSVVNDAEKQVDVYLNGVLMTSGSSDDYVIAGTDTVGFRFDLDEADVIAVVVR
jgi:hypothetical protein